MYNPDISINVYFVGMSGQEVLERLRVGYRLPKPIRAPDSVYRKMRKCWDKNTDIRPTFSELHDFFDAFFIRPDDVIIRPGSETAEVVITEDSKHEKHRKLSSNSDERSENDYTLSV